MGTCINNQKYAQNGQSYNNGQPQEKQNLPKKDICDIDEEDDIFQVTPIPELSKSKKQIFFSQKYINGDVSISQLPEQYSNPQIPDSSCSKQDLLKAQQKRNSNQLKLSYMHVRPSLFVRKNSQNEHFSDHYQVGQIIGEGGFGKVFKVKHIRTKCLRAGKVINLKSDNVHIAEYQILKSLDHPNIVKILEIFQEEKYLFIVTELCEGGDLFSKIRCRANQPKKYHEQLIKCFMKQILSALIYLHQRKIVHRDLKPENILFDNYQNDHLKLIDFGASEKMQNDEGLKRKIGTPIYIAPEILASDSYNEKCDIWSCGIILYMLLCGKPPFYSEDRHEQLKLILKGDLVFPEAQWKNYSYQVKNLIKSMLERNPSERITAEEAYNDVWFQDNKNQQPSRLDVGVIERICYFEGRNKLRAAIQQYVMVWCTQSTDHQELINVFKKMDKNGDGTISKQEFFESMQGYNLDFYEYLPSLNMTFDELDVNNSGEVDFGEFITAAINSRLVYNKKKLEKAFNLFDIDKNGFITKDELSHIFEGTPINEDLWQDILNKWDHDKDGQISQNEFFDLLRQADHFENLMQGEKNSEKN